MAGWKPARGVRNFLGPGGENARRNRIHFPGNGLYNALCDGTPFADFNTCDNQGGFREKPLPVLGGPERLDLCTCVVSKRDRWKSRQKN